MGDRGSAAVLMLYRTITERLIKAHVDLLAAERERSGLNPTGWSRPCNLDARAAGRMQLPDVSTTACGFRPSSWCGSNAQRLKATTDRWGTGRRRID